MINSLYQLLHKAKLLLEESHIQHILIQLFILHKFYQIIIVFDSKISQQNNILIYLAIHKHIQEFII